MQMIILLNIAFDREEYDWGKVRELVIGLLNELRKDIGIDKTPIKYRGEL